MSGRTQLPGSGGNRPRPVSYPPVLLEHPCQELRERDCVLSGQPFHCRRDRPWSQPGKGVEQPSRFEQF